MGKTFILSVVKLFNCTSTKLSKYVTDRTFHKLTFTYDNEDIATAQASYSNLSYDPKTRNVTIFLKSYSLIKITKSEIR